MTDFDDWEMLQAEAEELEDMGEAEEGGVAANAEGLMMLRLDHFSIHSGTGDYSSELSVEGDSVESGGNSPSWIDPAESGAVVFHGSDDCGEMWRSDRSRTMSDCGEKIVLGFAPSGDDDHVFEVKDQMGCLGYQSGGEPPPAEVEAYSVHEIEKMSVVSNVSVDKMDIEVTNEKKIGVGREEGSVAAVEGGEIGKEVERPNEADKKDVIWWKVPLELVKFCVFRVSPLWSVSVAVAMVGVFIMRRRLQNMKRKSKSLQIKVTVDHKKVDQFMSRAARLNEAFSVVKRVPIIRPSLPAPGVTPWPVMSMR